MVNIPWGVAVFHGERSGSGGRAEKPVAAAAPVLHPVVRRERTALSVSERSSDVTMTVLGMSYANSSSHSWSTDTDVHAFERHQHDVP